MRRLTVIALAGVALLAAGCDAEDAPSGAASDPSSSATDDPVPASPPSAHATTSTPEPDRDAPPERSRRSTPSSTPDGAGAAPDEHEDAGGEPIGVADEVTIVIIDPDD
jgi:hypothetical protein